MKGNYTKGSKCTETKKFVEKNKKPHLFKITHFSSTITHLCWAGKCWKCTFKFWLNFLKKWFFKKKNVLPFSKVGNRWFKAHSIPLLPCQPSDRAIFCRVVSQDLWCTTELVPYICKERYITLKYWNCFVLGGH